MPHFGIRPLTLDEVSPALILEYGLRPGGSALPAYRCDDPSAVSLVLDELMLNTARKLHEPSVRWLLARIRDRLPIDPVPVFREPGAPRVTLLDGMHRWRVSRALGLACIPCNYVSRVDAETRYGYYGPT